MPRSHHPTGKTNAPQQARRRGGVTVSVGLFLCAAAAILIGGVTSELNTSRRAAADAAQASALLLGERLSLEASLVVAPGDTAEGRLRQILTEYAPDNGAAYLVPAEPGPIMKGGAPSAPAYNPGWVLKAPEEGYRLAIRPLIGGETLVTAAPAAPPVSVLLPHAGAAIFLLLGAVLVIRRLSAVSNEAEILRRDRDRATRREALFEESGAGVWQCRKGQLLLPASLRSALGFSDKPISVPAAEAHVLFDEDDAAAALAFLSGANNAPDARFLMMNNDGHKQPVYFNAGLADETGQGPSRTSAQDVGRAGVAVVLGSRATEDERAQKLIRHLQETLDALPQAFAHWDGEGQLIAWNHHFCELLGIPSEELRQGMRVQRVAILAGPRGSLLTQHLSPLASGQRSGEVSLSDGRRLHFIRQRTASRGWVSVAQDITDRYAEADTHARKERELQMTVKILEQSRQELKELNERYALECQRAEDANRAKTEFLANISHELRTPLNAINGFSALMQSELYGPLGSDKYSEYVNDIHDSGKHLLELINEILDLSKVEAGRMELRLNTIDLEKILTESIRVVEPQTREA
ncbi:MAG: histidine kinase dimerization/phospho-acceptor domain-containing protein, partial [Pseudomonadota bacterium]